MLISHSPEVEPACSEIAVSSSDSTLAKSTVSTYLSPWLLALCYPLGYYGVLPFYFNQIDVIGQENLPTSGPVILAPTHRSRWDAIIVPYAAGRWVTGRDLRFMVSVNEIKGVQGWFIDRMGGFGVNPDQPTIATLRYGVEVLQKGETLVMFPEGGIFKDGQIHALKPGMARLALQAESSKPELGIKIVPINIHYSPLTPHWRSDVRVAIGSPLHVADYATGATKPCASRLTTDLAAAMQALD